jgi:hypothetical protein
MNNTKHKDLTFRSFIRVDNTYLEAQKKVHMTSNPVFGLLSPPIPSFSGIPKVKTFY